MLLFSLHLMAQENLVPNPSFEELRGCPFVDIDIQTSTIEGATHWVNALHTADLFHPCFGAVPVNDLVCYQEPRTGQAYGGLYSYVTVPVTREYMETDLTKKLEKGKRYYLSFFVSARDCLYDMNPCRSDAIAMAFSDSLYQEERIPGMEQIPPFVPVLKNPAGNILSDTVNWVEIGGCYTANGTEQYLIIGGFKASKDAQSEGCVGASSSYLYIDDVGVYEYDPLPDTVLLCRGESVLLGKPFLHGTYKWNTGQTASTIEVDIQGRYVLDTYIGDCILSDTVDVVSQDELLDLLPVDTTICKGEGLDVCVMLPGTYEWQDGNQNKCISIRESGEYSLRIENKCGIFERSFYVESVTCDCDLFVPNVFTPNGDGINDYLEYYSKCDFPYKVTRFQVYNRWGELVYSSNIQGQGWDGKFLGKPLSSGIYCWIIEYEYIKHGNSTKEVVSGDVLICL